VFAEPIAVQIKRVCREHDIFAKSEGLLSELKQGDSLNAIEATVPPTKLVEDQYVGCDATGDDYLIEEEDERLGAHQIYSKEPTKAASEAKAVLWDNDSQELLQQPITLDQLPFHSQEQNIYELVSLIQNKNRLLFPITPASTAAVLNNSLQESAEERHSMFSEGEQRIAFEKE